MVVVPGEEWHTQTGEFKSWFKVCQDNKADGGHSRQSYRFDKRIHFHRVQCLNTTGVVEKNVTEDDIYVMQVNGLRTEQIITLLTKDGLSDVTVLGLDGFKNAASIMQTRDTLNGQSFYGMYQVEKTQVPNIKRFWDLRRCFRLVQPGCQYALIGFKSGGKMRLRLKQHSLWQARSHSIRRSRTSHCIGGMEISSHSMSTIRKQ